MKEGGSQAGACNGHSTGPRRRAGVTGSAGSGDEGLSVALAQAQGQIAPVLGCGRESSPRGSPLADHVESVQAGERFGQLGAQRLRGGALPSKLPCQLLV